MHFSTIVTAVTALAAHAAATPTKNPHPPRPYSKGLAQAMVARGRTWIGTAVTFRNDSAEAAIYGNKADFNSITPENAMKWESIEPQQGNFTFADADRYADYVRTHGIQIHCHNLVWHSQLPTWVSGGNWTQDELIGIMTTHINALAGRYKGVCTRWDVVNEALNENGTYRASVFYDTLGESFLPLAFKLAHAADPDAQLYYNDYNLETIPEKAAGARRIVELVQAAGAPIHGVGMQAHLAGEVTPSSDVVAPSQDVLEGIMRGFTDLGVHVGITELDVRMNVMNSTDGTETQVLTPQQEQVQKGVYERVAGACLSVEGCIGMTVWGVSDKYSWIPGVNPGEGAACMWDEDMQVKPARQGFLKGILTGR